MTELTTTNALSGVLAKKNATLDDALGALVKQPETPTGALVTPLPKQPALSKAALEAIRSLPALLASAPAPEVARRLTDDELEVLTKAMVAVKAVKAAADGAEKKIKPAFHNHFNAVARENDQITPTTLANDNGYILEDLVSGAVKDFSKKVTRETSKGAVIFNEESLRRMEEDGVIDHARYLKLTRVAARVLDEHEVMEALASDKEFAQKMVPYILRTPGNTSLNLRSND